MWQRLAALLLALQALAGASACTPTVATTWGYSSWYRRGGAVGDLRMFEIQRNTCLSELEVPDPASLTPGGREERQFLQCMNGAGWCSQMWDCN